MNQPEHALEMLVNATRLLASDADVQERTLPDFVVVTDELALNFDNAFQLSDQLMENGRLSQQQLAALQRVDKVLEDLTNRGEPRLWTLNALRESHEWQAVRAEARKALEALGVGTGTPSIEGLTYVGGDSE